MRLASLLMMVGHYAYWVVVFHKTVPSSFASSASGTPVLHAAAGLLSPFVSPQISDASLLVPPEADHHVAGHLSAWL